MDRGRDVPVGTVAVLRLFARRAQGGHDVAERRPGRGGFRGASVQDSIEPLRAKHLKSAEALVCPRRRARQGGAPKNSGF